MKTALIASVTGQEGAYLSRFLLDKGYSVLWIKGYHLWIIKEVWPTEFDILLGDASKTKRYLTGNPK